MPVQWMKAKYTKGGKAKKCGSGTNDSAKRRHRRKQRTQFGQRVPVLVLGVDMKRRWVG